MALSDSVAPAGAVRAVRKMRCETSALTPTAPEKILALRTGEVDGDQPTLRIEVTAAHEVDYTYNPEIERDVDLTDHLTDHASGENLYFTQAAIGVP